MFTCEVFMNCRLTRLCGVVAPLVILPMVGCGDGAAGVPRYDVAGTVTFNGQPVPQGTIQFRPDASQGNSGPAGDAEIVDGRYDTASVGNGTVGGPHEVIITGFDGKADPDQELPLGMPLFSDYSTKADMPKTAGGTVDFEVPGEGQ